jgi:hypothetical protein
MAKFVGTRDFEFFQHVNRELSAEIVDTPVILYKLNLNYGVELTAFVDYKGNEVITDSGFGIDSTQEAEFRFVRRILQERHVYPEIGDVIGYNDAFYEIDNVQEVQLIAGRSVITNQSYVLHTLQGVVTFKLSLDRYE